MATNILFKNPDTGETKAVKVGWSWTLFLFSNWLGVPLFIRRLNGLGILFACLWLMHTIAHSAHSFGLELILFFVSASAAIWIGVEGNKMTAKNYLTRGWKFADPDSDVTRSAKMLWGMSDDIE